MRYRFRYLTAIYFPDITSIGTVIILATEILMPKLGLTMKTGTIVDWLKNEGDSVSEKEPVLEIETEKLSYSVEAPAGGTLLKILASIGEKYPIAAVLGYIGKPGEIVTDTYIADMPTGAADSRTVSAPAVGELSTGGRVFISPVARKLASEMNIDYRMIKGTGPNGRIVKADVLGYSQSGEGVSSADRTAPVAGRAEFSGQIAPDRVIPYTGLRRAVGETMKNAWMTIPMVTHQVSADAGALLEYRAMLNDGVADKSERVTIGELLIKLTAAALSLTPIVNSTLTDEGIVLHSHINIGMATALDEGLLVPVIHDADRKGLLTICREAKELAARTRSGALAPDDVHGATFTVSNLGPYGSVDFFTPIINPPQAAILGVGRIVDTIVRVDGEICSRPTVGLSLTYDHRIIDGATAAGFIKALMDMMKNPARAVLNY